MDFSSKQAGLTRQQSRTVKGADVDQTKAAFEKLAEQEPLDVIPADEAEELAKSSWKDFFKGDEDDG